MTKRPTSHECPVPGCRETRPHGRALCGVCWSRLPETHRAAIMSANAARARHRQAAASIEATSWLVRNPIGAADGRRFGEGDSMRESL